MVLQKSLLNGSMISITFVPDSAPHSTDTKPGDTMAKYMIQMTYSDDALAELVRHPQDRGAVVSELFER